MWKYVESAIRPEELDTSLSQVYNYVRRNIQEVERKDESTGETYTIFTYEEQTIKKDEWAVYEEVITNKNDTETNAANIDYIAMMTDVELPE